MQIYFHSRLCSYLSRVPILVEGTVYICYTFIMNRHTGYKPSVKLSTHPQRQHDTVTNNAMAHSVYFTFICIMHFTTHCFRAALQKMHVFLLQHQNSLYRSGQKEQLKSSTSYCIYKYHICI